MKIKMLALILVVATAAWTQTANSNPAITDKAATPPAKASCPCCDKMAKDSKDMAGCCHPDAKDTKAEMPCCNAEQGKACMKASKDAAAGACCGKDAACCKEGASCCAAKDKAETAAKGCCAGGKCDRHAHQHATGL